MSVTTVATFTTYTPPEHALSFRYLCLLERGPTKGAFTLRIVAPRQDHKEVSSVHLRCLPDDLQERAREHVQKLHPQRGLVMPDFGPPEQWALLCGEAATQGGSACRSCGRPHVGTSAYCEECGPARCAVCGRHNDIAPQSRFCSSCR